jgi:hypothetical protein
MVGEIFLFGFHAFFERFPAGDIGSGPEHDSGIALLQRVNLALYDLHASC